MVGILLFIAAFPPANGQPLSTTLDGSWPLINDNYFCPAAEIVDVDQPLRRTRAAGQRAATWTRTPIR
jgi:hypothetical protein